MEAYHSLKAPPGLYKVLRIDGRSFSKFTRENFAQPFDAVFSDIMSDTMMAIMEDMDCLYGHTHSDEISVLLSVKDEMFDGSVEKLVSISASLASSAFTWQCNVPDDGVRKPIAFDSRLILFGSEGEVADYFAWRQNDAWKNCVGTTLHYFLLQEGYSARAAARIQDGLSNKERHEMLFNRFKLNANDLPIWQKRGVDAYWESKVIDGYNPMTKQTEKAIRRYLRKDDQCDCKDMYRASILEKIGLGF